MFVCFFCFFFTIAKDFTDPLKLNNNEILSYCMSNPICVWTLLCLVTYSVWPKAYGMTDQAYILPIILVVLS